MTRGTGRATQRVPSFNEPRLRMGAGITTPHPSTPHSHAHPHTENNTQCTRHAPLERTQAVHTHTAAPYVGSAGSCSEAQGRRSHSRPFYITVPGSRAPGAAKTIRAPAPAPACGSQLPSRSGELRRGWAVAQALEPSPLLQPIVKFSALARIAAASLRDVTSKPAPCGGVWLGRVGPQWPHALSVGL